MKRIVEKSHGAIATSIVVLMLFGSASEAAFAQESCARLVADATDAYRNGQLQAVLERTNACLEQRPSSSERESVFMFQTRAFLALDEMGQAQEAARRLLQVNPDFTPAVDDPERFRTLVTTIKRELAREGVSSVSKMTESVPEAPATVIVVTGEQIRQRGYQDLEEVLHDLPGFDISRINGQSYSNIHQRGYRSNATNRTLFLVDGVEQNDLHSNIAYISRQYPLSNIDRIEVVYGPASTMYGANAFLGVINVLTLDPDDMLAGTKDVAGEVRVGGGTWNTRSFDGTVAGRFRRSSYSVTARVFRSNEWDLSRFSEWAYVFDDERYVDRFGTRSFLEVSNPAAEAARLDRLALQSLNGSALRYSDVTDDWMISGKLKINEFLFGVQMWQTREGTASASTQWAEPGARNGNIWSPRQTSFYARYSTALSGSLRLSYFGQAKVHDLHPDSSAFLLQSYASGPLGFFELSEKIPAFWAQTRLAQSSNQLRHEVNVLYRARPNLSVLGGIDLRHSSLQMDYSKTSNCVAESRVQINLPPRFDPLDMLESGGANMTWDEQLNYYYPVVLGIYEQAPKFLEYESDRRRCSQTDVLQAAGAPGAPSEGGEHMAARDLGVFGQVSFNPLQDVRLVAAWRIDNGHVNVGRSYGTVATPRLAFVYSPRQFVFKAIYAEAFKDPAPLERFSSVPPGIRNGNPILSPEHVSSVEASAGHQGVSHSINLAVYRSSYRDVIGIGGPSLYEDLNEEFKNFGDKLADEWYFTPCLIEQCFINALRQFPSPDDRRSLVERFLNFHVFERRYENLATLHVWGSQLNATWQTNGMELFGNYTYTHPEPTGKSNRAVQVGGIAPHQGTIGVTKGWRSLNGSMRVKVVGARNLEPLLRGVVAYLASQGNRERTAEPLETKPNDSLEIGSHAVANAAVTYEFAPGWSVQTTINNVFNTSYAHPGIQDADNDRFAARVPQPGRTAFIRLVTTF